MDAVLETVLIKSLVEERAEQFLKSIQSRFKLDVASPKREYRRMGVVVHLMKLLVSKVR